ncbi:hypothetical protein SRB17_20300 [Streptomyces sp. RB17]|uniref:hypothetical protein n=1 Tax=Streptomyces sp. RB17 TaxID=2585197 RepID=UPI001296473C|nr:hypothetical protein [Streptomyces sp. RB17]MQY34064.1 hypothetical protein [Streptomyces sp. RB17]
MNESGTGTAQAPVEERLRAALAARAHSVRPADLRPLRPPRAMVRPRRVLLRRTVVGALALAAVAALVFFTVRAGHSRPTEPARPPHPTTGTPTPVPSPVRPSTAEPSPSAPHP